MRVSRREFGFGAALGLGGWLAVSRGLVGQVGPGRSTARPDVGAIERDRMVRLGTAALVREPVGITTLVAAKAPGGVHDYFSDATFAAHRDALRTACVTVGALAGAYGVTKDEVFAAAAVKWLRVWFLAAETRMTANLENAQFTRTFADPKQAASGTPEGVIEGVFLAEVAVALPFLAASTALTEEDLRGLKGWFEDYLKWLTVEEDTGPRIAALARDRKDHHGSSWLLQTAAMARFVGDDAVTSACRHRFERVTLRAQVVAAGNFPAELRTVNPYRNSLLNLDLLAGACQLLSTTFESVWDYELQDGPGMRGVIAYFYPYILKRAAWPYAADAVHFQELPLRRPALLFAARAYTRPEYADLWKSLPSDPPEGGDGTIAEVFPIRQPYLWVTRAPRRVVA